MILALSVVLALLGAVAQLIAGAGRWEGWLLALVIQPVWVCFALVSGGYGLILCSALYGAVAWRNMVLTRRRRQAEAVDGG